MLIDDSSPSPSGADLASFRASFDGAVPQDFLDFYARHNGGHPDRGTVVGNGREFTFQRFVPIGCGRLPLEVLHRDMAPQLGRLDFLPFGHDDGGNVFILSIAEADLGSVHLVTAETGDIYPVAASFTAFLDALDRG